jgi:putative oxygen-independent coproporphyrinogen III oxidase
MTTAMDLPRSDGDGFGLYVHWPFCLSKCPYCDFNSHVADAIDHDKWRRGLIQEMKTLAPKVQARSLVSIFFGGGTPSLMDPRTVAEILDTARDLWGLDSDVEITLEANPTSVETERLRRFRDAGVNRVSLGVQALNDDALRFLGRGHDAREAIAAVEIAHRCFEKVSFDLIYARPGQTVTAWTNELTEALGLAGDHLSLYQLTIEPGTAFHSIHQRGGFSIPDDDEGGALYEATGEILEKAGLPAYEVSNHARPGSECRHNLVYWRAQEYLGVGPGAHGRLHDRDGRCLATRTHRAPAVWLDRVEREGHAVVEETVVAPDERLTEVLMMGLRLREGVPLARLRRETGYPLMEIFDRNVLQDLTRAGYMEITDTALRATGAGRQRLNSVLTMLLESRLQ